MYNIPLLGLHINVDLAQLQEALVKLDWTYRPCKNGECNHVFVNSSGEELHFNEPHKGFFLRLYRSTGRDCNINTYNSKILKLHKELVLVAYINADNIELSSTDLPLMQEVSIPTLQALNDFLSSANKDDGGTHSCDKNRWNIFIQTARKEQDGKYITEQLKNVLITQYQWSEKWAEKRQCDAVKYFS